MRSRCCYLSLEHYVTPNIVWGLQITLCTPFYGKSVFQDLLFPFQSKPMTNGRSQNQQNLVVSSNKMNGRTNVSLQYGVRSEKPKKHLRDNCCFKFWYCLVGSATYRNLHRKNTKYKNMNSVSVIDRISRFCFPILFIAFNLFYWIVYLEAGSSDMLM